MSNRLYYGSSKNALYAIAIAVAVVLIVALAALSYLITNEARINNERFARKAFDSKYESVRREFKAIEEYHTLLTDLVSKSISERTYTRHFSVLNALNDTKNLVQYNWYFRSLPTAAANDQLLEHALQHRQVSELHWKKTFPGDSISNILVNSGHKFYWIIYDSLQINTDDRFYFGSTISLNDLHDYFTRVGQNQNNYAFVFTRDGTCITHPELKFVGRNVVDFTDIRPHEFVSLGPDDNIEKTALSEYLGVEVTRFIRPLKTKNFDGYVAVNYANLLIDENVRKTQYYTAIIFVSAFTVMIIIFVLFYTAANKAYREKEKSELEKKQLLIDNETMHKEQAMSQLRQLKNQINPHFLFNSLNSLYMLISLDRKKAQDFTLNLSGIYRYLIVSPQQNLVYLKDELAFIEQYMALQKTRFQDEISFEVKIEDTQALHKKLPYLALQIAVENAIKHNEATVDKPLIIIVTIQQNVLTVQNTFQPRNEAPVGEGFGLAYLQQVYAFFKKSEFRAGAQNNYFVCRLPLLEENYPLTPEFNPFTP